MARKLPPLSGKAKKIKVNVIWFADNEQDLSRQTLLRNRDSQNNVIYPYDFVSQWINEGQAVSKQADNVFVTDSTDIGFVTTRVYSQDQMLKQIDIVCSYESARGSEGELRRFLICKFIPNSSSIFQDVITEILNLHNPNEFELGIKNIALRNNQ